MTEDIGLEHEAFARSEEHRLRQNAMRAVFDGGEWLTTELINARQLLPPTDKSQPAAEWKRCGLIFSIVHDGEERFPRYQFDARYQPKPVIGDILKALGSLGDSWKIAAWFHFSNGWITESPSDCGIATPVAPKDALHRPNDVVAAALNTRGTYVT